MKRCFPLLLGLVIAGCTTTAPITKVLTLKDNGLLCTIPAGAMLVVELPSNPTTGYEWQPVESTAPVLELVHSSYFRSPAPAMLEGAGGTETFRLQALKPGRQQLQLKYVRPWEIHAPPAQTVSFGITVTPP